MPLQSVAVRECVVFRREGLLRIKIKIQMYPGISIGKGGEDGTESLQKTSGSFPSFAGKTEFFQFDNLGIETGLLESECQYYMHMILAFVAN